jgi:hypothetical protein
MGNFPPVKSGRFPRSNKTTLNALEKFNKRWEILNRLRSLVLGVSEFHAKISLAT